jgi:arylsulfatase A-like enzyme
MCASIRFEFSIWRHWSGEGSGRSSCFDKRPLTWNVGCYLTMKLPYLHSLFVAAALIYGCAVPGRAAAVSARPNILWVVSEDNTFNYVGAYGDPLARTPNIDAIAARGILFGNFYSAAPVCAPGRSTTITGRYASSLGSANMRSTPPLPDGVKFFPEFLRAAGYFCTNNAKTDYNTSTPWNVAWNENGRNAHWRHRQAGQPFFAVFNFEQSHESRLHTRQPLITDPAKVRVPAYLPDNAETRADLAQYYDCVSRADAAIGTVLRQLKDDGLEEDTIVIYFSDNGGCTPRSKRFLYDNGTHCAMAAYFPPRYAALAPGAAGTRSAELVNFIDLAPTVLSLAGVPRPAQFQGRAIAGPDRGPAPEFTFMFRDRMDERYDLARAVTDGRYRYIRNYYPDQPWGLHTDYLWKQASMREWARLHRAGTLNATQRAFFEPKAPEELFDCANDPDNVHNLAADPAQQARLARMRQALRAHLLATRDLGFVPEPLMVEWAAGRAPTTVGADESRYPLARLLDVIDTLQLSVRPDPAALERALHAPETLVRYWGVVAAQRAATLPVIAALLADNASIVRLATAEALLRRGENPAAWAAIEHEFAEGRQPEARLFALNVLARLPRAYPAAWRPRLARLAAAPATAGTASYLARAAEDLLNPGL